MKKYLSFILIYLFILPFSILSAQESIIDSLKSELKTAKTDSLKIFLLTEITYQYINIDTEQAKVYCEKMLKEAETTTFMYGKAEALRIAGNFYNINSDYEKAIEFYKKAGDVYSTVNSRNGRIGFAKSKMCLGTVFDLNGDFKEALTLYIEAEPVFYELKDYTSMLNVYNCIANIYMQISRYDLVQKYNEKMESVVTLTDNPYDVCRYYVSLANLARHYREYGKAEEHLAKARQIAWPAKYYMMLTTIEYNYGNLLSLQKKYDEAQVSIGKAIEYARKAGMKYEECDAIYNSGLVYLDAGKTEKANTVFLNALGYAREIGSKTLMQNILKALADLKSSQGDYQQAYKYQTEFSELSQQIYSEEDQKQVNFLNAKYEAAKKESRIRQLTAEKRVHELESQKRMNFIYFLSFVIIALAVILFFVFLYYKNKKKIAEQNLLIQNQKIKELEKEKQLASVNSALEGEEKERLRLARDLHDGLGGLLSGAKMSFNLFWGSSPMSKSNFVIDASNAEMFEHALSLLNQSISELQRVAHNMMPQALINCGLKEAISEFCENINSGSQLALKFHFFGKEKKLDNKYELSIYRIVQELVNNILKHSNASEAFIQLVQEESRLNLVVQDNGKGFDISTVKGGHGLNNIRTRVEALGGYVEIISGPGKGTEVSLEFENLNYAG